MFIVCARIYAKNASCAGGTFHKQANYEELNLTAQCSLCIVKLKKHVRVFERVYQIQLFLFQITLLTSRITPIHMKYVRAENV